MIGRSRLGTVPPAALTDARLQAHWAAQALAAAGERFLAPVPDTSHTNLEWIRAQAALAGDLVPGAHPFRLALRIADLHLLLLDAQGAIREEQALVGSTVDDAYALAAGWARTWTRGAVDLKLVHPGYDMPAHAAGEGAPFDPEPGALAELARWFDVADDTLRLLAARHPDEATPVRCWPHHFDLALLLELAKDSSGAATRTVGVGLSPGDEIYDEPYWYVNHWPGAASPELADLSGGGVWHTQGWTGAILRGRTIVREPGADEQATRLETFLSAAIAANRRMAGG